MLRIALFTGLCLLCTLANASNTIILHSEGYTTTQKIEDFSQENIDAVGEYTDSFAGLPQLGIELNEDKRVFGEYERDRVYDTSEYKYRVVGQVENFCTGTLVGKRHMITAAHCVYSVREGKWNTWSTFTPGRISRSNSPYGQKAWKKIYVHEDYIRNGDRNKDFAIIELKEALGDKLGWRGYGWSSNHVDYTMGTIIGYPGDKENGTQWEVTCPMTFTDREIVYRCDTYGGMSGSGVILDSGSGDNIYGIHTLGRPNDNSAVRITKEIFHLIKSWINNGEPQGTQTRVNTQQPINYFRLHYENGCHQTIWTALHYRNLDKQWVTNGWWKLSPGQKAYVANTRNRYYYIYAQNDRGTRRWSGNYSYRVRGKGPYNFKEEKIGGTTFRKFTQEFRCDN